MSAKNRMWEIQLERFEIFKAQDPESSHFDVTFEVEGKLIYANKYVLQTISATFDAMLSERWKNKDDVIKLDTYSYDNFYLFLTFIYSCDCELAEENIAIMTDMAEFYGVASFKDFCDEYMSKIKYNYDNILQIVDLVRKYSLPKSKVAVDRFTAANFSSILQSDQFMDIQKITLKYFVTFERGCNHEEQLFETVYKWAEKQLGSKENPSGQIYANNNEVIKAELTDILPCINFKQMNLGYFSKFIVPKGFFNFNEISDMLCHHLKITVTVTDGHGRLVTGSFVDTFNVYDSLKTTCNSHHSHHYGGPYNWLCNIKPSIPSDLKKNENVQYYFVLEYNSFQVKKPAQVNDTDYLICEMEGDPNFYYDTYCRLNVSRN